MQEHEYEVTLGLSNTRDTPITLIVEPWGELYVPSGNRNGLCPRFCHILRLGWLPVCPLCPRRSSISRWSFCRTARSRRDGDSQANGIFYPDHASHVCERTIKRCFLTLLLDVYDPFASPKAGQIHSSPQNRVLLNSGGKPQQITEGKEGRL